MTTEQEDALKLDRQLCFPLYATARKITGAYTPYLKPLGLTYTQYIVFLVLWESAPMSVGEIGQRLHLDNGTLTPLLKKLETAGYITRTRSTSDERIVTIDLTDAGQEMREKCAHIPAAMESLSCLQSEETQALYRLLYKLLAAEVPDAPYPQGS